MAYLKTNPYMLQSDEGQRLHSMGALISIKATSDQTNGAFNLFEVSCPPGFATLLHIHYCEDVVVFVMDGTLSFFWSDEKKEAAPGSYFYQPRGTPHGFRVEGSTPARILYMTFPAGLDRFLVGSERISSCTEAMVSAAQYKIEILGPLPD